LTERRAGAARFGLALGGNPLRPSFPGGYAAARRSRHGAL
jgi:hypothetical protein